MNAFLRLCAYVCAGVRRLLLELADRGSKIETFMNCHTGLSLQGLGSCHLDCLRVAGTNNSALELVVVKS